eukprot:5983129-Pleurochrysis_carterae.AAC.3
MHARLRSLASSPHCFFPSARGIRGNGACLGIQTPAPLSRRRAKELSAVQCSAREATQHLTLRSGPRRHPDFVKRRVPARR